MVGREDDAPALVIRRADRIEDSASGTPLTSDFGGGDNPTGMIYTNLADMPSLVELLQEHSIKSAIFERSEVIHVHSLKPWKAALAGGIAAAFPVAGLILLVSNLSSGIQADPYVSLLLLLGGLVLLATLTVSLRARGQ